MSTLFLLGAGGFGAEVADICETLLATGLAEFDRYFFLDDSDQCLEKKPHLHAGSISDHKVRQDCVYVCTVAATESRLSICQKFDRQNVRWVNIIHPRSIVSASARLGSGVIVCANSFISCHTTIGHHVQLNVSSNIGHDTEVGSFCTFSSQVDITGNCKIDDGAFFGSGSRVLPNKKVGSNARIGAGCVVSRNVSESSIYYAPLPILLR